MVAWEAGELEIVLAFDARRGVGGEEVGGWTVGCHVCHADESFRGCARLPLSSGPANVGLVQRDIMRQRVVLGVLGRRWRGVATYLCLQREKWLHKPRETLLERERVGCLGSAIGATPQSEWPTQSRRCCWPVDGQCRVQQQRMRWCEGGGT